MRTSSNAIRKELEAIEADLEDVENKEFQKAVREIVKLMKEWNADLDEKELRLFGRTRKRTPKRKKL